MKKLLFLLFLLAYSFAQFQLQSLDVSAKLSEAGTAAVEERINLIIFGQYSMQLYESGFNKNTLSAWQDLTNITDIRTHISAKNTDIRSLVIRPQPLQKSQSGLEVWYGQIILDYVANPYYGKEGEVVNGTGMVTMDRYKPRTTRYTLNENAFDLPRTETGDIKVDSSTSLTIAPPASAMITYVNPLAEGMHDTKFPAPSQALTWGGLTLVQFSLTYEVEQSLDKEVVGFFSDLQQNMRASLLSQEGMVSLLIAAILVISYFYLRLSRR